MLPKNRRITAPLLLSALKKSTPFQSPHLTLRVHNLGLGDKLSPTRIAIIVPSKVSPRSVDRHLSKRKISLCLENNLNLIKPGRLLIFQVKKDITKLEQETLLLEVKSLITP